MKFILISGCVLAVLLTVANAANTTNKTDGHWQKMLTEGANCTRGAACASGEVQGTCGRAAVNGSWQALLPSQHTLIRKG